MRLARPSSLRTRLTFWYVAVLALLLLTYATLVFAFQYVVLTHQLSHDEVQDVVTVEGLLYFDSHGVLQLHQDYYSRPQSHLLVDRLMEVRDIDGQVLYRSSTLNGMSLGGPTHRGEGDTGFDDRIVRLDDGTHVFAVSHIHGMQGRTLIIRLGYSLAPLRARMIQFLILLLVAIPLALILAGAAGHAIAAKALRPVGRMAERASKISSNNLHDRLEISVPPDELAHLAIAFNQLLDRLEQAFAQLKRFTADAAHELRTPIAALRTIGEVALEHGENEAACREALGGILEETSRLNETIDGLLLLARAEAKHGGSVRQVIPLRQLVDEVTGLLEVVMEDKGIAILVEGHDRSNALICGERALLRTAIMNVVHNAIKFSPEGGKLRITYSVAASADQMIKLTIADDGPGIADGEFERVFDRFFTSSSRESYGHHGSGLGLSVARLAVERSGGTVSFDPTVERGACCVIAFPTTAPAECGTQAGNMTG